MPLTEIFPPIAMSFKITLSGLDSQFLVADGETILDAATRQNIDIPYSCYSGICTTCKATCLKGQYDYGDMEIYGIDIDDNPNNELLLCCAYPKSDMIVHHPELAPEPEATHLALQANIIDSKHNNAFYIIKLKTKNHAVFNYWPGQYLLIEHQAQEYPFSIANAPSTDGVIELHILDATHNPAPTDLLATVKAKQPLTIKGPLGIAHLRETSDMPIILVAGGSGFASIKPMLEALLISKSEREIYFYWGVRSSEFLYMDALVKTWAKANPNFHYIPVVSGEESSWAGRDGLVHNAVLDDFADLANYQCYLSGPFEMAFAARDAFINQGAKRENIFSDAFEFEKEWE